MDQVARENIAAAAAVRRELGSSYDDVIAEIAAGYVIATWAHIRRQIDDRGD